MTEHCEFIDYEDMIADLTDDVEGGYIKKDSMVYIVRQSEAVYCEALQEEICPVVDYFYDSPARNMVCKNCINNFLRPDLKRRTYFYNRKLSDQLVLIKKCFIIVTGVLSETEIQERVVGCSHQACHAEKEHRRVKQTAEEDGHSIALPYRGKNSSCDSLRQVR